MSSFKDYLADVPDHIPPIVNTDHPNHSIFLVKDSKFKIKTKERVVVLTGNIEFKWFPQAAVYFEGNTDYISNLNMEQENFDILTINDEVLGQGFVIRERLGSQEYYVKGIFSLNCMRGESTIRVKEVRFVVPNMRRFDGLIIKNETKSYSGRISLNFDDKEIILDKLPDFEQRLENLKKVGGYHVTYSGKITFQESKNLNEMRREKEILNCFLQILNGKQVFGLFFTGMHEGEIVWQDFRSYPIESYHERGYSCFPLFLKKEDVDSLATLYNNIQNFWKQEDQKGMIKLAVGWYLEANTKPYYHFDTSLIISQSALEMFYNWLMVEKNKIIRGKTNLSAANKIRLLLYRIGLNNEVPDKFSNLKKFLVNNKNNNEEDAVDAVVLYRNAIVHGDYEKRVKLQSFTSAFKGEAKHLSIWYLELCILYVLGYNGRYNNRTTAKYISDSEEVPWNISK